MFAYLQNLYRYNINSLYIDDYNDDEYLFNANTISNWANEYNIKVLPQDVMVIYEDIPPYFNYN
jgi:hypothetical protein